MPGRPPSAKRATTTQAPLDWLNFFLADVQAGVGPFLAIFLLSSQHWDPGKIGVVMMIAGVATVAARAPFGALIDWTRWKRALVVMAAVAVATGAVAISLFPNFWLVAAAQTLIGSADAVFPAAVGAISLGIVGPELFTQRVGRNEAFNHAGNVSYGDRSGARRLASGAACRAVAGRSARRDEHSSCARDQLPLDRS
jgi:MFS family permease